MPRCARGLQQRAPAVALVEAARHAGAAEIIELGVAVLGRQQVLHRHQVVAAELREEGAPPGVRRRT